MTWRSTTGLAVLLGSSDTTILAQDDTNFERKPRKKSQEQKWGFLPGLEAQTARRLEAEATDKQPLSQIAFPNAWQLWPAASAGRLAATYRDFGY